MKKYFLSIVALAGMLFATSCQESLVEPQVGGPTTFTVQVPDQMGTKANGDSYKLFVEVYSAYGDKSYHRIEAKDMAVGTATTVTLNLVANQAYDIIFWAQKNADSYGVDDLSTVQMNANHHNSETGAAFYAVLNNYNPTQGKQDVKLTRPFAQLNFYTNTKVSYGSVQVLRSTIKITDVATSFNRVDNDIYGVGATTGTDTYTYTSSATEDTNRDLPVGDSKNIDGVSYQYVSMDYLAVPGNEALVDIEATFFVKDSKDVESEIKHTFEGIPVQMNYRTNIIGNLITSASDFKVEISEDWKGEYNNVAKVSTAAELKAAIENTVSGEIVLINDIELTESLVFGVSAGTKSGETAESGYVLDLNGKTISGNWPKANGAIIKNNGNLRLAGGTIASLGENGGSAVQNNGTMTIENVTLNGAPNANGSWPSYTVNNTGELTINNSIITSYHGSVASYGDNAIVIMNNTNIDMTGIPGFTNHGIYTYNNGEVIVNGGNIANNATDQGATGGSVINGSVTVNSGQFKGRIENYSGTPVIKGGTFDHDPSRFVVGGYRTIEKDGKYYVVEGEVDNIATTNEDLKKALESSNEVYVVKGDYTFPSSSIKAGQTIICEEGTVFTGTSSLNIKGSTVIGATFENEDGVAVSGTIHGTFKNCEFIGNEALRWCYSSQGNPVVFEDCVIKTNFRGFHFDDMNGDVTFKGCEIAGFNAFGGDGTITFEGCTFTNDESIYNGLNIYANTYIKDCAFKYISGKTNFIDMEGIGKTLTIENSSATLDGNTANITDFVGGSKLGENIFILDGNYCVKTATSFKNICTVILADGSKNVTIELANDIDLAGIEWPAVKTAAAFVLDGKGHSIKNLTTSAVEDHGFYSTAMFTSTRKATTIKNLVVENATVTGKGGDNSHGAVLVACNYAALNIEGVTVKNSTVSNCDRSSVITTYLYFTTATVKNCVVEGCTVNSIGTAGALLGMNNSHNFEATGNTVKNTTISSSEGGNKAGILIGTWQNAGTLTSEGNTHSGSKAINAGVETNNEIGRHA